MIAVLCKTSQKISIHAPTRGATWSSREKDVGNLFQSTLPHGERRRARGSAHQREEISIHAPTRGATRCRPVLLKYIWISIHAPTRGATSNDFVLGSLLLISIHAPTRGATNIRPNIRLFCKYFNPRSHTGSDGTWMYYEFVCDVFQSTLPHGERRFLSGSRRRYPLNFNPRSHTGSDHPIF